MKWSSVAEIGASSVAEGWEMAAADSAVASPVTVGQ